MARAGHREGIVSDMDAPDQALVARIAEWIGEDESRAALLATIMDDGQMGPDEALYWAERFEAGNPGWADAEAEGGDDEEA